MTHSIRRDISVDEVYKQAKQQKNGRIRARLLGIAALLEGKTISEAEKIAGIAKSNLHVWRKRFNQQGIAGLLENNYHGKQSTWTTECEQFLQEKAFQGPLYESDKRVMWRLKDFQALIEEKFGIRYGLSTIWYKLKELKASWISVRQQHPKSNPLAQEEFKKKSLI